MYVMCLCNSKGNVIWSHFLLLGDSFFVYNDISSRYYQPLSMRPDDHGYKHYILWHIKFQWVAISEQVPTSECFLQHCCNSVGLWQVYMQVRKKKTGQKLIVTEPANKPINKGSCLKPQHQPAGISGWLANALGSASCASSWSFILAPLLGCIISTQLLLWTT